MLNHAQKQKLKSLLNGEDGFLTKIVSTKNKTAALKAIKALLELLNGTSIPAELNDVFSKANIAAQVTMIANIVNDASPQDTLVLTPLASANEEPVSKNDVTAFLLKSLEKKMILLKLESDVQNLRKKIKTLPPALSLDEQAKRLSCPISKYIFRDPVILSSGYTIERQLAEELLRGDKKCPLTRAALTDVLTPNLTVASMVKEFLEMHPSYRDEQFTLSAPVVAVAPITPNVSASSPNVTPTEPTSPQHPNINWTNLVSFFAPVADDVYSPAAVLISSDQFILNSEDSSYDIKVVLFGPGNQNFGSVNNSSDLYRITIGYLNFQIWRTPRSQHSLDTSLNQLTDAKIVFIFGNTLDEVKTAIRNASTRIANAIILEPVDIGGEWRTLNNENELTGNTIGLSNWEGKLEDFLTNSVNKLPAATFVSNPTINP